jgi:hypothetical protein|tara:strand:+ start:79 stop:243 length:165 start_codon:yes stop_codon:yes gene_type:complete
VSEEDKMVVGEVSPPLPLRELLGNWRQEGASTVPSPITDMLESVLLDETERVLV